MESGARDKRQTAATGRPFDNPMRPAIQIVRFSISPLRLGGTIRAGWRIRLLIPWPQVLRGVFDALDAPDFFDHRQQADEEKEDDRRQQVLRPDVLARSLRGGRRLVQVERHGA